MLTPAEIQLIASLVALRGQRPVGRMLGVDHHTVVRVLRDPTPLRRSTIAMIKSQLQALV